MFVIVNGNANGGKGRRRWHKVHQVLEREGAHLEVAETGSLEEADTAVRLAIESGQRRLVAAGGDGTVNGVLNALMTLECGVPDDLRLGAIGLGSSNDFHKPLAGRQRIARRPVRLNADAAQAHDVGEARLFAPSGNAQTRYFLLNGGLGLVAKGNAFFNTRRRDVGFLKRASVEAAIIYSALYTIVTHRPVPIRMGLDGAAPRDLALTNLGILKKIEFAGGMRYDTEAAIDDGLFDVNLWHPMSRLRILRMIAGLYRGKFKGAAGTECRRAREVELSSNEPFHLELDGEVHEVVRAEIRVRPRALHVCA